MPDLGIIGVERSGKTSLFNALTGADQPVGFATHQEPHLGMVTVPDERLERLSGLVRPKKTTPVALRYVDFPGAGFGAGDGLTSRFLEQLVRLDALLHVVRAFDKEAVPHPRATLDPARDMEELALELAFADLALVEKRLERIAAETKALKASEREAAERESALLQRVQGGLNDNLPLRAQPLSEAERVRLRQYRFVSELPLLTILNINERDAGEAEGVAARFRPAKEPLAGATAALCASLEMELRGLSREEAEEYRRASGLGEGALAAALRLSYQVLALQTFFTVGKEECRAWAVPRGTTALRAAGQIHSDMERGFIRAEVVPWRDLVEAGSEAEARKRALLHTEGRDYVVQDGDVLHILFNV